MTTLKCEIPIKNKDILRCAMYSALPYICVVRLYHWWYHSYSLPFSFSPRPVIFQSPAEISLKNWNSRVSFLFIVTPMAHKYTYQRSKINITTKPDFSSLPVSVDASLFPKLPTAEAMRDAMTDQPLPTHARGYFAIIVSRTTFLLFCEWS